jgi:hypothetical protein
MPLGSLLGGAIGTAYSLRTALWISAIGGLTSIFPVLLSSVSTIEEMPEPVTPAEADAAGGILEPTASPLAADA